MTKRIAQKHKIDRRLSVNLWGRPKSPFNLRKYKPGQHGQKHSGKLSDFGVQLNAKQKLKGYYGNLNERQFRNCYKEAIRQKGDSGENLIAILERRLDTIVYRSKFVPTVFAARQFINHGHVKVNGKKVNIGSYQLKEEETIEVRDTNRTIIVPQGLKVPQDYSIEFYDDELASYTTMSNITLEITNYEYENNIEENKRNIYVLKSVYLNVILNDMEESMLYKEGSTQYLSETLVKGENIRLYS